MSLFFSFFFSFSASVGGDNHVPDSSNHLYSVYCSVRYSVLYDTSLWLHDFFEFFFFSVRVIGQLDAPEGLKDRSVSNKACHWPSVGPISVVQRMIGSAEYPLETF